MTNAYLALGDSYTIGEAVPAAGRWCHQVVYKLRQQGLSISLPDIVATTGWTTEELLQGIANNKKQLLPHAYNLVSVLIGVNNQYRKLPLEDYKTAFRTLLQEAIHFAGNDAKRVVVLSIPDWGHTPYAKVNGFDEKEVAQAIDLFNGVCKKETAAAEAHFINITPSSRQVAGDTSFIASDELHFSEKMYQLWAEQAAPVFKQILTA